MHKLYTLVLLAAFSATSLLAQTPPLNDNCAGAIILNSDTSCVETAYSTEYATQSLGAGFWCAGNPDDDVWFRFEANSPCTEIAVTGLNSFDATVQLFNGTCSNLSPDPCADATGPGETESLVLENLIVGQTYFFRVFDRGPIADQTDFIFEVCVQEFECDPIVSFDFPCVAVADSNLLTIDGTIYYFNNTGTTIDDNEFLITPSNGICDDYDYSGWCSDDGIQNSSWASFVAPSSGAVAIDVCNNEQTEILTQLALYSYTDCNNFSTYTFIAGNEVSPDCGMGSQLSTCDLTPGEQYLILVDGYQIAMGDVSISISELDDPNAGADNSVDLCKNTPDYPLLDALPGADSNGFWIDVDATGNVVNGTFNAQSTPAGTYEFIYVVEGFTCFTSDSATVTVTTQALADAGENGVQLACTGAGEINLFTALNGTPETGGYWFDPTGASFSGMFDPDTDPAGQYTYVIASDDINCPQDSSFAYVQTIITTGVDAGEDAEADVCTNNQAFNMIDYLGGTPDENGDWFDEFSVEVSAVFDPATQAAGNYFYIVSAAGCGSAFSILTINIIDGPDAGSSADSALCFNGESIDMFTLLGGTPETGGTWKDEAGNVVDETFDPLTDTPGVFWYSVAGAGCPTDSASVIIYIDETADAGSNATSWTCYDANEFFLINLLGGDPQPGGDWTDPNGDPFDGFFNPASDISGAYTYAINGGCDSASAVLNVNVEIDPHAGTGPSDTATLDVAFNESIDLWDQLEDVPETSGSWVDLDNAGNISGTEFTPDAANANNTYTFAYVVNNVCGSDSAFVLVHVVNSVGINEVPAIQYKMYPNPMQDQLTIESSELQGAYVLKIYDLSGRVVKEKTIIFTGSLGKVDLILEAGSYLCTLADNKTLLINATLIVQ